MICEKCGKEIPENETVCPYCGEQEITETEEVLTDTVEVTEQEPAYQYEEFAAPVTQVVRKKRGLARVIIGIVSLVMAVAMLVVSFLSPVILWGKWSNYEEIPVMEGVTFNVELSLDFTTSGTCNKVETLVNYEELGFPKEESVYTDQFAYEIVNDKIRLNGEADSDACFKATPTQLTIWEEGMEENALSYTRSELLYPSMILWMGAAVFLILGVLLVAIPGKKQVITLMEEPAEAEDLDEFLEDIYEEIQAEDEVSEEVIEAEEITEEIAEEMNPEEIPEVTE